MKDRTISTIYEREYLKYRNAWRYLTPYDISSETKAVSTVLLMFINSVNVHAVQTVRIAEFFRRVKSLKPYSDILSRV